MKSCPQTQKSASLTLRDHNKKLTYGEAWEASLREHGDLFSIVKSIESTLLECKSPYTNMKGRLTTTPRTQQKACDRREENSVLPATLHEHFIKLKKSSNKFSELVWNCMKSNELCYLIKAGIPTQQNQPNHQQR